MKIDKAEIEGEYVVRVSGEISFREKDYIKEEFNLIAGNMKKSGIKNMLIDKFEKSFQEFHVKIDLSTLYDTQK